MKEWTFIFERCVNYGSVKAEAQEQVSLDKGSSRERLYLLYRPETRSSSRDLSVCSVYRYQANPTELEKGIRMGLGGCKYCTTILIDSRTRSMICED